MSLLLARAAAVVSVGCGVLHGVLLVGSPAGWLTGVHVAVVLACLPCAVHLWRRPGRPAWAAHASLALLMVAAHPLATALTTAGHHTHRGMPTSDLTAGAATTAPFLALLSLGVAGVALAGGWLRPQSSGTPAAAGAERRVPQA